MQKTNVWSLEGKGGKGGRGVNWDRGPFDQMIPEPGLEQCYTTAHSSMLEMLYICTVPSLASGGN